MFPADSGGLQNFYSSLKQVFGPTNRSLILIRLQDSNVFGRQQIMDRWHYHYRDLFNTHVPCDSAQLDVIPDRPTIRDLDATPSREKEINVFRSLKNGKSPGVDRISGEVLKHGGEALHTPATSRANRSIVDGRMCTTTVDGCENHLYLQKERR